MNPQQSIKFGFVARKLFGDKSIVVAVDDCRWTVDFPSYR